MHCMQISDVLPPWASLPGGDSAHAAVFELTIPRPISHAQGLPGRRSRLGRAGLKRQGPLAGRHPPTTGLSLATSSYFRNGSRMAHAGTSRTSSISTGMGMGSGSISSRRAASGLRRGIGSRRRGRPQGWTRANSLPLPLLLLLLLIGPSCTFKFSFGAVPPTQHHHLTGGAAVPPPPAAPPTATTAGGTAAAAAATKAVPPAGAPSSSSSGAATAGDGRMEVYNSISRGGFFSQKWDVHQSKAKMRVRQVRNRTDDGWRGIVVGGGCRWVCWAVHTKKTHRTVSTNTVHTHPPPCCRCRATGAASSTPSTWRWRTRPTGRTPRRTTTRCARPRGCSAR